MEYDRRCFMLSVLFKLSFTKSTNEYTKQGDLGFYYAYIQKARANSNQD